MKHYKLNEHRQYKTIVLANGQFPQSEEALSYIDTWLCSEKKEGYYLACCDGSVNKLMAYADRKLPDIVVGDLDSINPKLKQRLAHRLVHILDQESNDLSKTFHYLHKYLGQKSILLLGASGGREDHTLGNISLLVHLASLCSELVLLTDTGYFKLIKQSCSIDLPLGTQVSIFSFSTQPISVYGLRWEIDNKVLPYLWSGTLNEVIEPSIRIETDHPIIIFVAS